MMRRRRLRPMVPMIFALIYNMIYRIHFLIAWMVLGFLFFPHSFAYASHGDIDTNNAGYQWAWNDIIGWIDWDNAGSAIQVDFDELSGWAVSSALGDIALNCATTPSGNVCGTSNFKVSNSSGPLSGWAWSGEVGWIAFDCQTLVNAGVIPSCASVGSFGVTIQQLGSESFFHGWAWNDVVGWISFHCENQSLCVTYPEYKIQTSAGAISSLGTLTSNVFDTQKNAPAYYYLLWQGDLNGGTVQLQFASSSNSSGPWNFNSLGIVNPNQKALIIPSIGKRYAKYRIMLSTDVWRENTPAVKDVILNYSP